MGRYSSWWQRWYHRTRARATTGTENPVVEHGVMAVPDHDDDDDDAAWTSAALARHATVLPL